MSHTVDFQSAREAVHRAKRALKDAELRFDTECGPENSISLMNEIRTAEKRVVEAVSVLKKVPPSSFIP